MDILCFNKNQPWIYLQKFLVLNEIFFDKRMISHHYSKGRHLKNQTIADIIKHMDLLKYFVLLIICTNNLNYIIPAQNV